MSVTDAGRLAAAPLMTAIDGRVQLPGLPASDEAMAERLLALVDDALQALATSNELPGRVVVVRQPDVSTIARPVSPARMAQIVQAEVERVVSQAVRADAPAAASAPMVYFRDEADVVRTLAQRMATNRPTTDWFWPSVVEGWTPSAPPERAITLLMERALATPVPVATLAHVVDTLASTGALDTVLERFTESDGRTWLKAIRWPEAEAVAVAVPERADGRPSTLAMTTRSEDLVRRWVERWGGGVRDSRAVWLGAMLVVADRPERGTDPRLPQAVRVWLESVVTQGRSSGGEDGTDGATIRTGQRESLMADARAWLQSNPRSPLDSLFGGGPPFPLSPRDATSSPSSAGRPPVDDDSHRSDHASVDAPTWRAPRHTDNAGFALLVPLLTHVGLPRILASDPTLIDRDWPTALLLRLSRPLGVAFDDPVIAWIPARPASIAHTDRVLTAEVIRAARIRLRMNAGITMRQLVRRPGAVVAGSEQVDVLLQSAAIDSGLVRARLDAEPAWVPWLERALHFHYLDAVDLSA